MSGVDLALAKLDEQRKTSEAPTELGEKPKRRPGRISTFTQEIADEICERLSSGETLEDICDDEHMPASRTVRDWREKHEAFAAAIARARDYGHEVIAARSRNVARGKEGFSTGDVQRDKLIIETDLKLLAKWDPKKYGDRIQHEHSGGVIAGTIVIGAATAPKVIEGRADVPDMLPKSGSDDDAAS